MGRKIAAAVAVLAAGVALAVVALPRGSKDREVLEKLLPEGTYFYLAVPNDPARGDEYRKSNLHRLVNHAELKRFVEPIEGAVRDFLQKNPLEKELGLSLNELWTILGGPLGFGVFDVPGQPMPGVAVAIGSEDVSRLKEAAEKVKKATSAQAGWTAKESQVQGHTVHSLGPDPGVVHYALVGTSIVASPSRPHLEALLARAAKAGKGGFAEDDGYRAMKKRISPQNRHLVLAYGNLATLWTRIGTELPPEAQKMLESLALKDLTAFGLAAEYDLPQLRERYVLATARQDRGIVKFLAGTPAADAAAQNVPKDATGYFHAKLSLLELYDTIIGIAKSVPDGDRVEAEVKDFEKRMRLDLRRDLLGKLGAGWTVYTRAAGKQAEVVVTTGLQDPKGFFDSLQKILAEGGVETKPHATGFSVPVPASDEGLTVVVSGVDGRLFVGLTSEDPAKFTARVRGGGAPLRDNPRLGPVLAKLPNEVDAVSAQDLGASLAGAMEALGQLPPEMASAMQDPKTGKSFLAPDRLPKAETLKELLGASATCKRTEPGAIVLESVSDVGGFTSGGVMGAGVAAAVLLPAITKAIDRAQAVSCANNLSQLWKMQNIYMIQFGGRTKSMSPETGSKFWLVLAKTSPPLIDESTLDIFVCPLSKQPPRPGFTTYRGPKVSVNKLAIDDVVGCCEPGCHPGGTINVLRKSGDVVEVGPDDPLHAQALEGTVK